MVKINAPPFGRTHAFNFSLAMVEAMGASGLTIVSQQPTAAMLEAGAKAGNVSIATAAQIYTAMIGIDG